MNAALLLPALLASAAAAAASLLACIPGLHVYNVLGLLLWIYFHLGTTTSLAPELLTVTVVAMISAYAVANTIPAILLAAPDESALHTVLPGQKMLREGKGREAVMLTAHGSLAALFALLVALPILPRILPTIYAVTRHHTHWILWAVILFMLLSEWPKPIPPGTRPLARFGQANKAPAIGLLVFLLSGLLGFVLLFRSPLPHQNAFLNLMPAFIGLFTLPWLLYNACSNTPPPPQQPETTLTPPPRRPHLRQGALAGILGGGMAAFFPVITGGVGGMLAGHASALRQRDAFLVSQGAAKTIYYAGGVLLLFVPGLHLARGGGGAMLRTCVRPGSPHLYWLAGGAALLGGATALLLLRPLANRTLALAYACGYRRISACAAALTIILVTAFAGLMGIAVMLVATGIGLLPLFHGTRRMNGLGVILLPIACSMSGLAPAILRLLAL